MGKGRKIWGGRVAGGAPVGEPFVWKTLALITSDAYRFRSINCARLLDFLEAEHLKHGGSENGSLVAPYTQLQAYGIGRQYINPAITEAETRKLIEVKRGNLKGRAMTDLNRFRLTYCWTKVRVNGLWDWFLPTDEWKSYSELKKEPMSEVTDEISSPLYTSTVHDQELASVYKGILALREAIDIAEGAEVHKGILPSISRGGDPNSTTPPQRERSAPIGSAVAKLARAASPESSRLNGPHPGKSAA
ncbi:MAG: hypothetical protein AB7F09_06655 [Parvibaculaceae bacterium]